MLKRASAAAPSVTRLAAAAVVARPAARPQQPEVPYPQRLEHDRHHPSPLIILTE